MQESYHTFTITIGLLVLYYISYLLMKLGKLPCVLHKKIWNFLLAISFLLTGTLGLVLAYFLDNDLALPKYQNMLWLHVEFGIGMALIAIFHLVWHFRYYFPKNRESEECKP